MPPKLSSWRLCKTLIVLLYPKALAHEGSHTINVWPKNCPKFKFGIKNLCIRNYFNKIIGASSCKHPWGECEAMHVCMYTGCMLISKLLMMWPSIFTQVSIERKVGPG